jgi:hypothetical protein
MCPCQPNGRHTVKYSLNLGRDSVDCATMRIGYCVAESQGQGKGENFMKLKAFVRWGR